MLDPGVVNKLIKSNLYLLTGHLWGADERQRGICTAVRHNCLLLIIKIRMRDILIVKMSKFAVNDVMLETLQNWYMCENNPRSDQ